MGLFVVIAEAYRRSTAALIHVKCSADELEHVCDLASSTPDVATEFVIEIRGADNSADYERISRYFELRLDAPGVLRLVVGWEAALRFAKAILDTQIPWHDDYTIHQSDFVVDGDYIYGAPCEGGLFVQCTRSLLD